MSLSAIKDIFINNTNENVNSITFSHVWTIDNFRSLYDENPTWKWEICSDIFSPPNNEMLEFYLVLYPKGRYKKYENYVGIQLGTTSLPLKYNGKIECQWEVSIVNENGAKNYTKGLVLFSVLNYYK